MVRQLRTKPRSRSCMARARTMRAVPTHPVRQMHRIMLAMLRFMNEDSTMISGSDGIARLTLMNTMISRSAAPP